MLSRHIPSNYLHCIYSAKSSAGSTTALPQLGKYITLFTWLKNKYSSKSLESLPNSFRYGRKIHFFLRNKTKCVNLLLMLQKYLDGTTSR